MDLAQYLHYNISLINDPYLEDPSSSNEERVI